MKRTIYGLIIFMGLLIGCSLLLLPSPTNRGESDRTTDTWSSSFESAEESLMFLSEYLTMFSEVLDAEYHIVFHDNSGGLVPGPSDWDIRAALKVTPEDIPLWTEGMKKLVPGQIDVDLWNELKSERFTWQADELVEYWRRPDSRVVIVVYPESGIILKMTTTMSVINWNELVYIIS